MARQIDRTFAKVIAIKRLITGSLGVLCGVGVVVLIALLDRPAPPLAFVCAAIFLGGGGWALRDGIAFFIEARRG